MVRPTKCPHEFLVAANKLVPLKANAKDALAEFAELESKGSQKSQIQPITNRVSVGVAVDGLSNLIRSKLKKFAKVQGGSSLHDNLVSVFVDIDADGNHELSKAEMLKGCRKLGRSN